MTERNPDAGQGDESEPALPADEEAAWAQIVAGYEADLEREGRTAADLVKDVDLDSAQGDEGDGGERAGGKSGEGEGEARNTELRSFTVYPVGAAPRDWQPPAGRDGEDDEGHFVPPEPPPLPPGDTTTRFAWLAVLGGPLLLLAVLLFRIEWTWWIGTLGVGGFLGGFATLLTRMRDDEDDGFDDPGRGAVV